MYELKCMTGGKYRSTFLLHFVLIAFLSQHDSSTELYETLRNYRHLRSCTKHWKVGLILLRCHGSLQ